MAHSLSGPPSPGQLALPAALGTRWSPCRRPSRDAQTEDLRSPTSTGLGRGVAAPFARRRPNRVNMRALGHVRPSTAFSRMSYDSHGSNSRSANERQVAVPQLQTRSDRDSTHISPYADSTVITRNRTEQNSLQQTRTVQWSRETVQRTCNTRDRTAYSDGRERYGCSLARGGRVAVRVDNRERMAACGDGSERVAACGNDAERSVGQR